MKNKIAVLFAAAAVGAVVGVPAWSALNGDLREHDGRAERAGQVQAGTFLAENEKNEHRPWWQRLLRRIHEEGEDDDDDEGGVRGQPNPAPVGTVAPPKNGLFGNGTPPTAKVN